MLYDPKTGKPEPIHDPEQEQQQQRPPDYEGETPFDDDPAWDIPLADAIAPEQNADQIEAASGFRTIPVGDGQRLVVLGFIIPKGYTSPIIRQNKEVFFGEEKKEYDAQVVGVKLALADDHGAGVVDYLTLPPGNDRDFTCYSKGLSKPLSEYRKGIKPNVGFEYKKFCQFIDRLGFIYVPGQPLPTEARNLKNWTRKEIMADIVPPYKDTATQKPNPKVGPMTARKNAVTGDTVSPRKTYVRLFSYRFTPETQERLERAGLLAGREAPASPRTAPRQPVPVVASPAALDNI